MKKNENIESVSTLNEVKKLSVIIFVIVAIVCVFYILTIIVSKKDSDLTYVPEQSIPSEISYTNILASDILNKNGIYYVLVSNEEDAYYNTYMSYIDEYSANEDSKIFYNVDLKDALNKNYLGDEASYDKNNLKFNGSAVLKISDNEVSEHYDGADDIISFLKELVD